ncbi:helix-turn-helix domain-containing protein [Streptomyces sp. NPDC001123]
MDGLRKRGLIDTHGHFTDAGRATKQRIETLTDELAAPPYDAQGPGRRGAGAELWASLIRTVQPPWLPLRTSALGAAVVRVVRKASAMKVKEAVAASNRALRRSASVACAETRRSASTWRATAPLLAAASTANPPDSAAARICCSRASTLPAAGRAWRALVLQRCLP